MTNKLTLSVSPHIHSGRSTSKIMLDVIIALLPTTVAGCIIFGLRALAVLAVCIASCVLCEYLFNLACKKKQTIGDLSAVVTGLLLGLNLPANLPLWQAVIGSIFAIIVVKCIFGGLGKNLVNPAITARVFMLLSFGAVATAAFPREAIATHADAVSSATPLAAMQSGTIPSLLDLFLGNHGGAIGEVCALALLIGGAYLIIRKVITWHIPVAFIGATFVFAFLFHGFDLYFSLAQILSGGLLIGAIFMATDYVTSPSTPWGKIIFGIGAAFLTIVIRFWASLPEGVSYSILLMNILCPYIQKLTPRKLFGGKRI